MGLYEVLGCLDWNLSLQNHFVNYFLLKLSEDELYEHDAMSFWN